MHLERLTRAYARFPAFAYRVGRTTSRAWHRIYVFPRLAPVICFPALRTGYMFSRAWHRLYVFPRLAPVICFPALRTAYIFSRAWHRLHVFPRWARVARLPALGTGCTFSRPCYWLHISRAFHRCLFPALGTICMSSDWFRHSALCVNFDWPDAINIC